MRFVGAETTANKRRKREQTQRRGEKEREREREREREKWSGIKTIIRLRYTIYQLTESLVWRSKGGLSFHCHERCGMVLLKFQTVTDEGTSDSFLDHLRYLAIVYVFLFLLEIYNVNVCTCLHQHYQHSQQTTTTKNQRITVCTIALVLWCFGSLKETNPSQLGAPLFHTDQLIESLTDRPPAVAQYRTSQQMPSRTVNNHSLWARWKLEKESCWWDWQLDKRPLQPLAPFNVRKRTAGRRCWWSLSLRQQCCTKSDDDLMLCYCFVFTCRCCFASARGWFVVPKRSTKYSQHTNIPFPFNNTLLINARNGFLFKFP